jgi:hypothetical protein
MPSLVRPSALLLTAALLVACKAEAPGEVDDDLPDELKRGGDTGGAGGATAVGSGGVRGGGTTGSGGSGTTGTGGSMPAGSGGGPGSGGNPAMMGAGGSPSMIMGVGGAMAGAGGTSADASGGSVDASPKLDAPAPRPDAPGLPPPPMVGGMALPCKYGFCESFEAYPEAAFSSNTTWARVGSKVSVGSAHVARGMRALRVAGVTSGQNFIRTTKPFPALAQAHYGRIFLWIDQEPQMKPATVYHWTAAELSDRTTGNGLVVRTVGGLDYGPGNNQLFFNIETHGMGETGRGDQRARLAPKVWHCLEWYVNRQGNMYKAWWNGQERTSLQWPAGASAADPKYAFPEFKSLAIGIDEYQPVDTAWDIWIDEVALHTDRIGCDG